MRAIVVWIGLAGCLGEVNPGDPPPPNVDPLLGCAQQCHGTDTSNAPPKSISGALETSVLGVGAHRQHLTVAPTWHRQLECADCHVVPTEVGAAGHMDGDNTAEVTMSPFAGVIGQWNGSSCTVGCHGDAQPIWTQVDGAQSACGSCHGAPPPAPHPADANCASCHPTMEEGSLAFRDPASHINGVVDVGSGSGGASGSCTSCHGSPTSSAPPKDLSGDTAPTARGVGAHAAHLATSTWRREIACSSCHAVPGTVDVPAHIDGDNLAEIRFDTLNAAGTYSSATATCTNQYCHGNGRGNNGTVTWTTPGTLACGSCHSVTGTGMSGDHSRHVNGEGMRCSECHGDVVNAQRAIIAPLLHVNGLHEIKMAAGTFNATTRTCTNLACHGSEAW